MLGCVRGTDLPRLRRARGDFVAIGAGESLSRAVVGMAERVTKRARVCAGRAISFLVVTHTAGRDLAARV